MSKLNEFVTPWRCPQCGAFPHECGEGECLSLPGGDCKGFSCECSDELSFGRLHGQTSVNQCTNAHCHHCGWRGTSPRKPKSGFQAYYGDEKA